MSTIDTITSYESVAAQPQTQGSNELGQEAFLNLLVTQLQYQDPLDPQDNEEFVAQLAQFSSLEQLTNANGSLESLYLAMASMNNASMTQLLGKEVRAYGDTFGFDGVEAELAYETNADLDGATITILDEDGSVVWSENLGPQEAGTHDYVWDGSTITGGQAEPGTYTVSVTPQGEVGDGVEVETIVVGIIDGMSFDTGSPVPSMHGAEMALGDIIEVREPDNSEDDEQ